MKKVIKKKLGFINKMFNVGKTKLPSRYFDKDAFKVEEEDLRLQYKNIGL